MHPKVIATIEKMLAKAGIEGPIALAAPPDPEMGDLAFATFDLAKKEQKSPQEVAKRIHDALRTKRSAFIEKVQFSGPYVNFFVRTSAAAKLIMSEIEKKGETYGAPAKKQKERVMIEYSQPNTHKEFHIGHLRNVCIGSAMVELFRFERYTTVSANYIGDIGAHVAKCLWYIEKYKKQDGEKEEQKGKWLGHMYAEASKKIEDEPALKEEVAIVQQKLEQGDPHWVDLWKKTKEWSMEGFRNIYGTLGVHFDEWFFESDVEKSGKKMVEQLLKDGIAKPGEGGAVIVDLTPYDLGIFLILKSDGMSLYATKDLALAKRKFKKYHIDTSINVVDNRQRQYFSQLFKTLELMGWKKKMVFLGYDFVTLPEGAMASRKGNVVLFMDLYADVLKSVTAETEKRHADWTGEKIQTAAKRIALGAIKFDMLKHPIDKVIVFKKDEALSFDGYTAPYVLYAVARMNSVLRKSAGGASATYAGLASKQEKRLLMLLSQYGAIVEKALAGYNPSVIAKYCFDVAQAFNEFYNAHRILDAETPVAAADRLALCRAVRTVLVDALGLLTIETVEEM